MRSGHVIRGVECPLEYPMPSHPGARFVGIVHHTDGEREYAYDRTSLIGKLDKAWDERC
jgi:hypothetical protein